ncbi:hypothetical protein [Catenibacillus scindens]|uniref:hypothetical protein n=1 Tax=Catenibacillus scindens TaxID=673271 RepID=UPI00320A3F4B
MKRKKIFIPICSLLIAGLVGGGIFAAVQVQNNNKTVEVVPVNTISTYDYGSYSTSYGRITSDVSQTIYLESNATIKEVYVQVGDTVTAGTPLIQYDTELTQLDIESKKLDIQGIDMDIDQANKDIQSLKNGVVPSGGISFDTPDQPSADVEGNDTNLTSAAPKIITASAATFSQTESVPQVTADTSAQTEPGTIPQSVPQAQSDTQIQPGTQPQSQSQTQPGTQPQSQSQTQPDTQPQSQSQTQPDTQPQSDTQPGTESETDPPKATESSQTSDSEQSASASETEPSSQTDTQTPGSDTSQTKEPQTGESQAGESQTGESQTEEPSEEVKEEKTLDKDFDFSKYENAVNDKGEMVIPCTLTTTITPEFINLIRGKNPDGSTPEDIPDPDNPDKTIPVPAKKVRLTIKDYDKTLLLDGNKLNEPFINTQKECTLQAFIDNDFQMPVDEIAELNKDFFTDYPQTAEITDRPILIQCTSQTQLTPEFIYILLGRNADGSENKDGISHSALLWMEDAEDAADTDEREDLCLLDPETLPLPYVTSIATSLADFIANDFELAQEPVKELNKDTALDVSHDHREVYEIYCDESTIITKDFINRIREEKISVILKIEGHASWITLDGSKMEEPSEKAMDTPIADFIANGIALNEEPDETTELPGDDIWGGGIEIGGGGISYTAEEIQEMLKAKQLELSRLQTQKRQAQLDLAKLQTQLENATVTSIVNGVVTQMSELNENTNTSDPFMVINSTEGLYLTGAINELDLGTLTVGQTISAMSWNTGASFDAVIKEVSPYPTTSADSYGQNPNSSSYPFIALISDPPEGLMENENVEITTGNNSMINPDMTGQNLYLSKAYIRTEDNGENCVFAANSEGRLERRVVVTGKVLGSYIEITNGAVTESDYLAFPYGKNIKEGVKTEINEENGVMYY